MKQRALTMANRPRVPTCNEMIALGRVLRCASDPRAWRLWLQLQRTSHPSLVYRARVMLLLRCARSAGP